ncbi:hypothetical protein [Mesomycoplasma neurolyticum]|uniref:hypothetical protein n=1 Tax=Mesomycoplasma neurolyticum TaxID=2120 RepID=UPI0013EC6526|nr:hypothetical protein [Mesomycoplasma neurolyticum]
MVASIIELKKDVYNKGLDSLITISALLSSSTNNNFLDKKMAASILNVEKIWRSFK